MDDNVGVSTWDERIGLSSGTVSTECCFCVSGGIEKKTFKSPIKKTHRLLGHQTTFTKQHFNDLSVNESETHGLHFSRNTQGF